jgi:hypothetical protein
VEGHALNIRSQTPTIRPHPAEHAAVVKSDSAVSVAGEHAAQAGIKPSPSGTYKHRDADKWRAYMRDYMKRRRAQATKLIRMNRADIAEQALLIR